MVTSQLTFRRVFITFLLWVILWIPMNIGMTKVAFAAEEFATSYDVVYDIDTTGVATITEKVALRNLTSEYYANQFKLTIGATDLFDIKAFDGGGALDVKSEKKDTSTSLSVNFNQQIAGLGKSLQWNLQFKSRDFAEKIGKVWEVRAPKVTSSSNLESYNLTISVPIIFGEPTLISPTPKSQTVSSGKLFLTFDKSQLETAGVSANFGNVQIFDFDLTYHLENKNLVPVLTNIALPPDTAYQDIIYQRINPLPINVTVDEDGNYLAWFRLTRGQKLDVTALGSAKLYSSSKVKNPKLSNELRQKYTSSLKYWEKGHPQIEGLMKEILGEQNLTASQKVKLIYAYVVNSLKYNPSRINDDIERLGAVTAISNPDQAVCMEFTDLFIALARSSGIPARELDGYAYTANPSLRPLTLAKDVLHAWPEYFDEKLGWVMVDPTWENTTGGVDYFNKLDLNHFVFAIKGLSSTQPVAAGSYKYEDQDSNDVKVTLSDLDFLGKPQLNVVIEAADPIIAGLPGRIKVKISNVGNSLYQTPKFSITTDKLTLLNGSQQDLGPIPAFGAASFEVDVRTKSLFDLYKDQIVINLAGQKYTREVEVKPLIFFRTVPLMIGGFLLMILAIYLAVLGGLIYRKRFSLKLKKK